MSSTDMIFASSAPISKVLRTYFSVENTLSIDVKDNQSEI